MTDFHRKHGYDVGTGNMAVMSLRIGLLIEELGELHAVVSKGVGDISEEHADLLYLLLGNCVTLGIDIETAFFAKHAINMRREAKVVRGNRRVSDWSHEKSQE
ncbi:MAG: nucleoside triphosphate pyrophosphohydrolase family protein [bacterium]